MINNPKKPIFIAFRKDEFTIGTTEPAKGSGENWFLNATPSVDPDTGKFNQFFFNNIIPILLPKDYFQSFSASDCMGIPITGLYVYIHPDNPIIKAFRLNLEKEVEELRDKVLRLEKDNQFLRSENRDLIERRSLTILDQAKLTKDIKEGGVKDVDITRQPQQQRRSDDEVVL